jgi:hypothetical protein
MRAISFNLFKEYCKYHSKKYDAPERKQDWCTHECNGSREYFATYAHDLKINYTPCKEKYCPVLQSCKKL